MKAPKKRGATPQASQPSPGPGSPAPRMRQWLVVLALCAVTLLAYSNSFSAGFTFDSQGLLLQDPRIHEATPQNIGLILHRTYWWPHGESGLYRPITTLSYLFNCSILGNGDQPAGYHWVNFLLHTGNVLLVYALARRLMRKLWPAVFVAAVWAVHPVLTESVTNMVGRSDLLAGMSLLSGFWMYLKSAETQGWRRWAWLAGLMAVTTVGVFSKESAVTIVGVIALYELTWWKERKQGRALLLGCLAVLPALAAMWYVRSAVFARVRTPEVPFWDNPLAGAGFWTAKLTAIKIMAGYLGLLVWPAHLSCDYSYAQIPLETGSPQDWLAWTVVAAVAAAALLMFRFNRTVFFFAGLAFVTFLPASNLVFPIGTIMAERFLYLPSIALAVCVVLALYAIGRRAGLARLAPVTLCLIVAAFTARTWVRNFDWRDDVSLMTAATETSPNSFKSHRALAIALYDSDAPHANIDRVIAEVEKSLAILDSVPDWRNNAEAYRQAGSYYITKGDLLAAPESSRAYQKALKLLLRSKSILTATYEHLAAAERARGHEAPPADQVKVADVERSISDAHLRLNDPSKALDAAATALELDPLNAQRYWQLATSYLADGRADEAAVTLVEGMIVTSDVRLRQNLLSLYRQGLDSKGCATVPGPNGPALNPSCEIVRRHTCAAVAAAIPLYLRNQRRDLADRLKDSVSRDFSCSAALSGPYEK
jgi:tetratricopeptide (TPR) repeat protein